MAGIFYIIGRPCGVLLMAQNRLIQEMIAQFFNLIFTLGACLIGLNWGLEGVSWGFLISQVFGAFYYYILVYKTISTRVEDLLRALTPGLQLNIALFLILGVIDMLSSDLKTTNPALYLVVMVIPGILIYTGGFLFIPVVALGSEQERWKLKFRAGLSHVKKRSS